MVGWRPESERWDHTTSNLPGYGTVPAAPSCAGWEAEPMAEHDGSQIRAAGLAVGGEGAGGHDRITSPRCYIGGPRPGWC